MKRQLVHTYNDIISVENLLGAWKEFVAGKRAKNDVQKFERNLMDSIVELHEDLVNYTYRHGEYESFYINDPKRRHIHKASVRDRLLHHAVYRVLYPFFDTIFINDSYSCRNGKGTHKATVRFRTVARQISQNHRRTCWVLKCDIKQFFATINHRTLIDILHQHIPDQNILGLLENIILSYQTDGRVGAGLPLGNLTSQLLANVYFNVFDFWVKHTLKVKNYIRYADDFALLSVDKKCLLEYMPRIQDFLQTHLQLTMHPNKVFIKTIASGVDFLGWVHFSDHNVLRTVTKHRMVRRIQEHPTPETFQSYLGVLSHGNAANIRKQVIGEYWVRRE